MQDVSKGEGRTVLFVSHNMTSVLSLCKHGVLLENGSVRKSGVIADVVDTYMSQSISTSELVSKYDQKEYDPDIQADYIRISSFELLNSNSTVLSFGRRLQGRMTIDSAKYIEGVGFYITIKNSVGSPVSMSKMGQSIDVLQGETCFEFELDTSMLAPDRYYLTFGLYINGNQVIDVVRNGLSMEIVPIEQFNDGFRWQSRTHGNVAGFLLRRIK